MQRYGAYKDSGVEWIGEIPEGWEISKGKALYDITTGKLDVNAGEDDGAFPFFTCSMQPRRINEYAFDCEALLVAGNGIVGFTQYYKGKFNAYQRTYVLSNFRNVYPGFLRYYVSNNLMTEVAPNSVGSVIQFIKMGDLRNFIICAPPLSEQQAIADYLDWKTAEIDSIVSQTERSIELLREYRKSVISEAVTKGLDPDAPMRDSSVEWIGEIPAGWFILPFKRLANVVANLVTPDNYPEYWQVAPEDMEKDTGRILRYKRVADAAVVSDNHLFNAGLILYSKIRPSLNKVAIAPFDGLCSADMYPISTNEDTRWLLYYMLSNAFTEQVVVSTNRVKMPKLNKEELGNMKVVLPDRNTQIKIADYLDEKTAEIDSLIADKQRQVELLREYRKSLISEAVTGKFKVPGLE